MAVTYTWDITNIRKALQLNNLSDVVVHVHWKCVGTDENGITGEFHGAMPLEAPTVDKFTPFENLTKEQVLGWVQANVTGSYLSYVKEQIIQEINKKNNQWTNVSEAPWGQKFNNLI